MNIAELFAKDINRSINGVIKVGQQDDTNIRQELEEYVVTEELKKHFLYFFLADLPNQLKVQPTRWACGFRDSLVLANLISSKYFPIY